MPSFQICSGLSGEFGELEIWAVRPEISFKASGRSCMGWLPSVVELSNGVGPWDSLLTRCSLFQLHFHHSDSDLCLHITLTAQFPFDVARNTDGNMCDEGLSTCLSHKSRTRDLPHSFFLSLRRGCSRAHWSASCTGTQRVVDPAMQGAHRSPQPRTHRSVPESVSWPETWKCLAGGSS